MTAPPEGDRSPPPVAAELTGPGSAANASNRQFVRNLTTGYISLVVSLILSLFLTPVVLRIIGAYDFGLWVVITSIGTYVSLLDTGVSTAVVQRVAACIAVHDDDRLDEVLATGRAFFLVTGTLAVAVTLAIVPFVGQLFSIPPGSLASAKIALALMGVYTGFSLLRNGPQAALFGSGRNDRQSVFSTSVSVAVIGSQILTVVLGGGLIGLFAVSAAGAVVSWKGTDYFATKTGVAHRGRGRASRRMLAELCKAGARNVAVSIASIIAYDLDALMIGLILPVRQVTPYDIGLSTAGLSQSLATTGTSLLLPRYAHSSALGDDDRQFRLYSKAVLASMAVSIPIVVSLLCFGPGLLHLWLHTVPPKTYQVLVALNIATLLQLPGVQSYLLLIGQGRSGLVARIALPAGLANLGFSVAATFWLGPLGPAIGSLPQVIIVDLIVMPVICCRILEVPVARYVREAVVPLLVPLLTAGATAALLVWTVGTTSAILAPVESVTTTLVAWAALLAMMARSDPALRRAAVGFVRRRPVPAGPRP